MTPRGSSCSYRPEPRPSRWSRAARDSFCCGGGGGLSFVDEPPDQRVNQERARQALATGADVIAVGCPFCLTMLEDGVNACKGDRETRVLDVAELLWEAVDRTSRGTTEQPIAIKASARKHTHGLNLTPRTNSATSCAPG